MPQYSLGDIKAFAPPGSAPPPEPKKKPQSYSVDDILKVEPAPEPEPAAPARRAAPIDFRTAGRVDPFAPKSLEDLMLEARDTPKVKQAPVDLRPRPRPAATTAPPGFIPRPDGIPESVWDQLPQEQKQAIIDDAGDPLEMMAKWGGRQAVNASRFLYENTPLGRITNALYGEEYARPALGLARKEQTLEDLVTGSTYDKRQAEMPKYGAATDLLTPKNTQEERFSTAMDFGSLLLAPGKDATAAVLSRLPGVSRALTAMAKVPGAGTLGTVLHEGAIGATAGLLHHDEPAVGGTSGALGALLIPGGRGVAATAKKVESLTRSARQRVGQAIGTTIKENKRWVGRNWERIARDSKWFGGLESIINTANTKASAAGRQLRDIYDGVRQGDVTGQLKSIRTNLQQTANQLLKQSTNVGIVMAPEVREGLQTIVKTLGTVRPDRTNVQALQAAHGAIDDALRGLNRELRKRGALLKGAGEVDQLFQQSMPGLSAAVRKGARSVQSEIDDLVDTVEPSRFFTKPLLSRLAALRRSFGEFNEAGPVGSPGEFVPHNVPAITKIDELMDEIRAHGNEMTIDVARGIRQKWDDIVAGARGKGFLSDMAEGSRLGVTRKSTSEIRGQLAQKLPQAVEPNREYSYQTMLGDVVTDTFDRRVGQTKGLIQSVVGGLGGFDVLRNLDNPIVAIKSATAAALAVAATRLYKSPEWNLFSAKARLALVDALRRGDATALREAYIRLQSESVTIGATGDHGAPHGTDLTKDEEAEFQQRLQQMGASGEGILPGITDPNTSPDDVLVPQQDVARPVDSLDPTLLEGTPPEEPEPATDEPQAAAGRPEVLQAGMDGGGLLHRAVGLLGPLATPQLQFPEVENTTLNKILNTAEQYTSPLDLTFGVTSGLRPILGTASRVGKAVEGVGRLASGATALMGADTLMEGVKARDPFMATVGGTQALFGSMGTRAGGPAPVVGRASRRIAAGLKAAGYETLIGPALVLGAEGLKQSETFKQLVPDEKEREKITNWLQLGAGPSIAVVGGYPKRLKATVQAEIKQIRDLNKAVRKAAEAELGKKPAQKWLQDNRDMTPEQIAATPWLVKALASADVPGGGQAWAEKYGPLTRDAQLKAYVNKLIKQAHPDDATRMQMRYWAKALNPDFEGVNYDTRKRMTDTFKVDRRTGKSTLTDFTTQRLEKAFEVGKREGAEWGDPAWIGRMIGNDPERAVSFARMVGAMSPGAKTHLNVMHGLELYLRHVLGDESAKQIISSMRTAGVINAKSKLPNIARAKIGARLGGRKVETLSGNELGAKGDIPIDLWLLRALGSEDEKSPEGRRYHDMQRAFINWSDTKGEDPFDVMAKVWVGMQTIEKARTPAFSAVGDQLHALGIRNIHHPAMQAYLHQPEVLEGLSARIFGKDITGKKGKGGARLTDAELPPLPPPPDVPDDPNMLSPEVFADRARALFLKTQAEGATPAEVRRKAKEAAADAAAAAKERRYDSLPLAATKAHDTSRQPKVAATMTVEGRTVEVVPYWTDRRKRMVWLDTAAMDEAWSRSKGFYVGKGGGTDVGGIKTGAGKLRYDQFGEFLQTGKPMEAPDVSVYKDGGIHFGNGRHRTAYLRDKGVPAIPVMMDAASERHAQQHGLVASRNPETANDTARRPKGREARELAAGEHRVERAPDFAETGTYHVTLADGRTYPIYRDTQGLREWSVEGLDDVSAAHGETREALIANLKVLNERRQHFDRWTGRGKAISVMETMNTIRKRHGLPAWEGPQRRRVENPIEGWHGSPADFNEFDSSYIGTGEGAQAFSRGLYFAEERKLGERYRDMLTQPDTDTVKLNGVTYSTLRGGIGGKKERALIAALESEGASKAGAKLAVKTLHAAHGDLEAALDAANAATDPDRQWDMVRNDPVELAKAEAIEALEMLDQPKPKGSLYNVKLHVDPEELIDWDAPIAKQPEKVKQALHEDITLPRYTLGGESLREVVDDPRMGSQLEKFLIQRKGDIQRALDDLSGWIVHDTPPQSRADWVRVWQDQQDKVHRLRERDWSTLTTTPEIRSGKGEDIHRTLKARGLSPEEAVEYLKSKGIKGTRFYDRSSRLYSDDAVRLVGEHGSREAAQAAVQAQYDEAARQLELGSEAWQPELQQRLDKLTKTLIELRKPQTRNYAIYDDMAIEIAKKLGITLAAATALMARDGFEKPREDEQQADTPR